MDYKYKRYFFLLLKFVGMSGISTVFLYQKILTRKHQDENYLKNKEEKFKVFTSNNFIQIFFLAKMIIRD